LKRSRNTLGPLIGYHGCDRKIAEGVLSGKQSLKPSQNDYDWLGPGIYFWVDSPERGLEWARELAARKAAKISDPYVIGAFIHPGLCLNLTDYGVASELLDAHATLVKTMEQTATPLPENTIQRDGIYLNRTLDCAVSKTLHKLRMDAHDAPYDSVYGIFEEGQPLYPNAGFKKKTHVQIAVIEPECVLGYFRVRGARAKRVRRLRR
jgi:hypothetical protein